VDKTFLLEIVTPLRKVFSGQVKSIIAPGEEGYFGVLPRHAAMLSSLAVGHLHVETPEKTRHFAISGGFAEVQSGGVRILAETAEEAPEIDGERAQQAKARAETRLKEDRKDCDVPRAQAALARATNRLKIAEFLSTR
jgi:F-type H+-transporting ATPase subunit epsilon